VKAGNHALEFVEPESEPRMPLQPIMENSIPEEEEMVVPEEEEEMMPRPPPMT
jgi:hypothetical protein